MHDAMAHTNAEQQAAQQAEQLSTLEQQAAQQAPELLIVKWDSPTAEIEGMVKLAQAMVDRKLSSAHKVCLVAPNPTWALQLHKACQAVGQKSSLCVPWSRLSAPAQESLNKLGQIADPAQDHPYAQAKCRTLIRTCGLEGHLELEHALLHAQGDEDAPTLYRLMLDQLKHPTVVPDLEHMPICVLGHLPEQIDYGFLVACVDGLVPPAGLSASLAGQDASTAAAQKAAAARNSFFTCIGAPAKRMTVSLFVKADKSLAQRCGITFRRCKEEHGRTLAMTVPSPYLAELGIKRPVSESGQALLRKYRLN